MKGTACEGIYSELFEGTTESFVKCLDVDYRSVREEKYADLQVNVRGLESLRDSLRNYTECEILEGENAFDAEHFGKQKAKKGISFKKFPPIL